MARIQKSRKGTKHKSRWNWLLISSAVCAASVVFYLLTQVGLSSYNLSLQQEQQVLADEIREKQTAIQDLQQEVHNMQDKERVLGMIDGGMQDNPDNITIIDSTE